MSALSINISSSESKITRADDRIKNLNSKLDITQHLGSRLSSERERAYLRLMNIKKKCISQTLYLDELVIQRDTLQSAIKELEKDIRKMNLGQSPSNEVSSEPLSDQSLHEIYDVSQTSVSTDQYDNIGKIHSSPELKLSTSPSNMRSPSPLTFSTSPPIVDSSISSSDLSRQHHAVNNDSNKPSKNRSRLPPMPMWAVAGNSGKKPPSQKQRRNTLMNFPSGKKFSNPNTNISKSNDIDSTFSENQNNSDTNDISPKNTFSSVRSRSETSLLPQKSHRPAPVPLWSTKGNKSEDNIQTIFKPQISLYSDQNMFQDQSSQVDRDLSNSNIQSTRSKIDHITLENRLVTHSPIPAEMIENITNQPVDEYFLISGAQTIDTDTDNGTYSSTSSSSSLGDFSPTNSFSSEIDNDSIPSNTRETSHINSKPNPPNLANPIPLTHPKPTLSKTINYYKPKTSVSMYSPSKISSRHRPMPKPMFSVRGNRKNKNSNPSKAKTHRSDSSPSLFHGDKLLGHKKSSSETPIITVIDVEDSVYHQSLSRSDSLPVIALMQKSGSTSISQSKSNHSNSLSIKKSENTEIINTITNSSDIQQHFDRPSEAFDSNDNDEDFEEECDNPDDDSDDNPDDDSDDNPDDDSDDNSDDGIVLDIV